MSVNKALSAILVFIKTLLFVFLPNFRTLQCIEFLYISKRKANLQFKIS